ncbi:MAG TPA: hypothetical protein VGL86_31240 [Polyangia bacterium]
MIAPLGLIPLFACLSPPVESPKTTVTQETSVRVEQSVKNKVDLLFMVDNSNSMAPKQQQLQQRFPQLIKQLDAFAAQGNDAWYHIGVVTSDLGAAGDLQACAKAGGDGAKLQVAPNPMSSFPAPTDCGGFTLGGGENFIDYNQIAGTSNVMGITGGALGDQVAAAFTCMASVGDQGCGFEHQLESPYRALHDNIAQNTGFLRSDAILAVVFVTDEDDCSASDTTDLFANTTQANSMYGVLQSFRCTQFGIQCNGMPLTGQSEAGLTGCTSYDVSNGGKLTDLNTYINFFTKPAAQGGVKADPDDVILAAISAPSDPVGVMVTMPCQGQSTVASCPTLNHSCAAASDPMHFFGDPAVRLNEVVNSAKNHNLTSICDTDYTAAINALGNLIISKLGVGCLNSPIANRADGTPDCVVSDVTLNPDGTTTTKEVPSCALNNDTVPCWEKVDKLADYNSGMCYESPLPTGCKLPSTCQPVVQAAHLGDMPVPKCAGTGAAADMNTCELASVSIDRGMDSMGMPNAAPPGTTAQVSCATIASSM